MTWKKYRNGGWNGLGPMVAMMAAQVANEWEEDAKRDRTRSRDSWKDNTWKDKGSARRRRGRMFASGELRLALLALINQRPRHGYELIREIEDMTGGAYAPSPGAVYPTLQMLEEEGLIKQAKPKGDEADSETGGKKPFKATKTGKAELSEREDEVEALMERLGEHGERAEKVKQKSPDLFRAMGNLASVLKNRANAGKLDKETIDQIVDIIDEVAKRIERL